MSYIRCFCNYVAGSWSRINNKIIWFTLWCILSTTNSNTSVHRVELRWRPLYAVFENTYFSFFSDFKKTWLFTFFWNDSEKKRKKSVAKILSSMMLTLLQKRKKSLLNVYRNFGLKTPGCCGYLWAFITHSSQLHTFLCPHCWARCLMLQGMTVTYRYWLPVIE